MNRYRAKKTITLSAGTIVGLDEKQAARRARSGRRIERLGAGRYLTKDALQMKGGETFGCESDLLVVLPGEVDLVSEKPDAEPDR